MVTTLTPVQARHLRLNSLLLAGPHDHQTPQSVAEWFGAMQAQDIASGHWSFGVRIPGVTDQDVVAACHDRQIVRTWPMRGTIHFVDARDVSWLLASTGQRALDGAEKRREYLGLDKAVADRAVVTLRDAVAASPTGLLTRAECTHVLAEAGISPDSSYSAYHLLWYASQLGELVIGPQQGSDQTFALASAWLPKQRQLNKDEALIELARRFFRSHGPATMKDFAGWTNMPMRPCRTAVKELGDELTTVTIDDHGEQILATDSLAALEVPLEREVLTLPGFDEYLLGFKQRELLADPDTMKAVIPGNNGMFRSTVVIAGETVAVWTRKQRAKQWAVTIEPTVTARRFTKAVRAQIDEQLNAWAAFVPGPDEVAVTYSDK